MAKLISFIQTQSLRFLHFVNHLSKNQLAALSTFFSLGFLSLILLNLHLYPNASRPDQGIEILVELKSEALTETLLKEEKTKQEELPGTTDPFESNQSYNTQEKTSVAKNTAANANSPEGEGLGSFEDKLKALAQKKQQALDSLEAVVSDHNNITKKTRVYYSLFERYSEKLPIPIYTCKQGGKVVIDIKVHPDGRVLETKVNTALSTTSNGCLLENALRYSGQSSFNRSQGKMQWGTITYYFQAK